MGKKLHLLGAFAFRRPFVVLGVWIALLIVLGFTAAHFIKPTSSAISIPGTEAQKALDRMSELFPDAGKGSARIVFAAPSGKTIDDYRQVIADSTTAFEKLGGVTQVIDPTVNTAAVSSDKTIAYTQLQLKNGSDHISDDFIASVEKVCFPNAASSDVLVLCRRPVIWCSNQSQLLQHFWVQSDLPKLRSQRFDLNP